jgi:hypothetical protein
MLVGYQWHLFLEFLQIFRITVDQEMFEIFALLIGEIEFVEFVEVGQGALWVLLLKFVCLDVDGGEDGQQDHFEQAAEFADGTTEMV